MNQLTKSQMIVLGEQAKKQAGSFSQAIKSFFGLSKETAKFRDKDNEDNVVERTTTYGEFFSQLGTPYKQSNQLDAKQVRETWKVNVDGTNEVIMGIYTDVKVLVLQDKTTTNKKGTTITKKVNVQAYEYNEEKKRYSPLKNWKITKVDNNAWTPQIIVDGLLQSKFIEDEQKEQTKRTEHILELIASGEIYVITGRDEDNKPIFEKASIPNGKEQLELTY